MADHGPPLATTTVDRKRRRIDGHVGLRRRPGCAVAWYETTGDVVMSVFQETWCTAEVRGMGH